MKSEEILAKGNCERIGIDGYVKHEPLNGKPILKGEMLMPSHSEALSIVIETLTSEKYGVINSLTEIHAVGHRVVHGGKKFSSSVLIDENVIKGLIECAKLAPLHIPANLMGIYACQKIMPDIPHVAVFDTAFHLSIPKYAYIYPIPYKYYEEYDIRRYGFHGTSHRYVSAKAAEFLSENKAKGQRIITCHLGNGASLAAIKDGKSIDTTMGATPLEGLPMGTRSGTIDPALVYVISEIDSSLTLGETLELLNKESGVLGISGVSSDFRDIISTAELNSSDESEDGVEAGDIQAAERSRLALRAFKYQVAKFIGAYIVALGGVDAIVFTAGVGENAPSIRAGICQWLSGFNIYIDEERNDNTGNSDVMDITKAGSSVHVLVIPTNEELVIARDTAEIVKGFK